jgi:hypothetical protein
MGWSNEEFLDVTTNEDARADAQLRTRGGKTRHGA